MFANGFYNNNYQIVQTPDHVIINVEMNHDSRIIRLNAKHRTDDVRPYFGDAIGWWEGDTLVVETTNIPQSQAFMGSWKNLKVTEKFKRVAEDRLLLLSSRSKIRTMWDAAWGGEYEFHPLETQRLYEYACHEGNYALHGILSGARVEEAAQGRQEVLVGTSSLNKIQRPRMTCAAVCFGRWLGFAFFLRAGASGSPSTCAPDHDGRADEAQGRGEDQEAVELEAGEDRAGFEGFRLEFREVQVLLQRRLGVLAEEEAEHVRAAHNALRHEIPEHGALGRRRWPNSLSSMCGDSSV